MEINEILNLVLNNGFAIVMAVLLFKQNTKLSANHKEEMIGMRDVLEKNTLAINTLATRLERLEK